MSILSGFKKYKDYIKTSSGYQLASRWTSSDTVEMKNGKTLTNNIDTTLKVSGAFADAKAVGDAIANVAIETDTTLTVSGAAADAKTVGDKIAGISTPINSINVYYDPSTDMIYVKDAEGVWHEWSSGGLSWDGYVYLNGNEYLDITGGWIATTGALEKNLSYNSTITMKVAGGGGVNAVFTNQSPIPTKGMNKITIVYDNKSNSNAEQSFFYLKNENLEIVDTFVVTGQGNGDNKVATLNIPSNCKNCYIEGNFNKGKMSMTTQIYIESILFSK